MIPIDRIPFYKSFMKIDSHDIGKTDGATLQTTNGDKRSQKIYVPKVPGEFVSLSSRNAVGLV